MSGKSRFVTFLVDSGHVLTFDSNGKHFGSFSDWLLPAPSVYQSLRFNSLAKAGCSDTVDQGDWPESITVRDTFSSTWRVYLKRRNSSSPLAIQRSSRYLLTSMPYSTWRCNTENSKILSLQLSERANLNLSSRICVEYLFQMNLTLRTILQKPTSSALKRSFEGSACWKQSMA